MNILRAYMKTNDDYNITNLDQVKFVFLYDDLKFRNTVTKDGA
jgi:hypothetical protein